MTQIICYKGYFLPIIYIFVVVLGGLGGVGPVQFSLGYRPGGHGQASDFNCHGPSHALGYISIGSQLKLKVEQT